jgi:glycine/D-amino acid oxidase-like deaminating enzyme
MQIETDATLPAETEVVVIGGGIVGVSAAYYIARRGIPVVLAEKGHVGAEQSSRNWGWCRQQNRDARELPMATMSLALWDRFRQELGADLGFRRCGLLYLSDDDAEIEGWANWCSFAAGEGVTSHPLSAKEATDRGNATGRVWRGGVFSESDGIADPSLAVPLIARGIEDAGGRVVQNCAVRGVLTEAGSIAGVVTERGEIRCRQVVMAGGAWASSFCNQIGIAFPQASVRSSILSVKPKANGLPDALHTARASVTRRMDGSYTLAISGRGQVDPTPQQLRFASDFVPMFAKRWRSLSPGGLQAVTAGHETRRHWALDKPTPMERMRVLDPRPNRAIIAKTRTSAAALLPGLQQSDVQAEWAGYIDSTPDGVPVIDHSEKLPGFLLAAGFSGHGFGIGPGAGYLIADLISGAEPLVDPTQYRLDRLKASSWGKVSDF